jgi:hypothetical protein
MNSRLQSCYSFLKHHDRAPCFGGVVVYRYRWLRVPLSQQTSGTDQMAGPEGPASVV